MGQCSGCGGKGHSPNASFHILGCGAVDVDIPEDPRWPRWNTFGMNEQLGIIKNALREAKLDERQAGVFADKLKVVLEEHYNKCQKTCIHR